MIASFNRGYNGFSRPTYLQPAATVAIRRYL